MCAKSTIETENTKQSHISLTVPNHVVKWQVKSKPIKLFHRENKTLLLKFWA